MEVKGRDLVDGFPKSVVLSEAEIREALSDYVTIIGETYARVWSRPPQSWPRISSIRPSSSPAVAASFGG